MCLYFIYHFVCIYHYLSIRIHSIGGLRGAEIPRKIRLISDEWAPETGLVTAAFKLRRKFVERRYRDIIDSMYNESTQNGPHSR